MNRWKVDCINWSHDGAPKAVAYRIGPEGRVNWQKYFRTHAEAITFAQNEARLTCTSCGRRMPYLEACIDGQPYCHPEQGQDCYQEVRWPGIYMQDVINASKLLAARPVDHYTFTKPARDQP